MTVQTTTTSVSYTGDGSTTSFPVTFPFLGTGATSEIAVIQRTISTGAEVTLTYTTDYTATGGSGDTGTVIAGTAPASTVELHIRRSTTETQLTDYVENDAFPAETHELALDRLTMIAQAHTSDISQKAGFPVTYTGGASPALPEPTANKALKWNAGGTALENSTNDVDTAIDAAAASAAAAAVSESAAAASETAAAASETAAGVSETNAAASYDAFDDRYLGSKSSAPSLDNDGDALLDGALYWDTTDNDMYVYDLGGTAWVTVSNSATSIAAAASASAASTSETNAGTSESAAATSASNASTSETNAEAAKDAAVVAQAAAEAALDEFTDTYLGAKATDPTVDNDGDALTTGDQYFNTGSNVLKIWNGSSWQAAALSANDFVSKTSGTGSAGIPVGTTAQRDGSPATGYFRYNSTETQFEGYDGSAWGQIGGGAGYFKGDNGTVGSSAGDIFRINEAELNANVTIAATENASATGPVGVASGVTLTVDGVLVII